MHGLTRSPEPRLQRALERIERNIDRCVSIIEELLSYARVRDLSCSTVSLDPWLAAQLEDLEVPGTVSLDSSLSAGVEVAIDPERLRQAVINVVNNACQAMTDRVDGSLRNDLLVASRVAGERVEIRVEDTGPGIAPGDEERIFEPLYSTRPFGVGLGLPLVKRIMEQHDGGVRVEPRPGGGTAMVLWLPAAVGVAAETRARSSASG